MHSMHNRNEESKMTEKESIRVELPFQTTGRSAISHTVMIPLVIPLDTNPKLTLKQRAYVYLTELQVEELMFNLLSAKESIAAGNIIR